MTRPDLFLDKTHELYFEKIAMPTKLSDAPEAWQREVASEVYKQLPFIADYAVNVVLDRVDAERGFAFGGVHVTNKSEAPMQAQQELPQVTIPVVVKEWMLAPLDLFLDGEGVRPLSEERLREKLFRTDTFETSTRKPSDRGIVDQLYPPMRTNYGMGSAGSDAMGIGKTANAAEAARQGMVRMQKAQAAANPHQNGLPGDKMASLIEEIAPTISSADADALVEKIATDKRVALAISRNPAFAKLAHTVAAAEYIPLEKRAEALINAIKPTVIQLQKLASGDFKVKWANAGAFLPQEAQVPPEQASAMAGSNLGGMQPGGTVTVGAEKAQQTSLMEEGYKNVSEAGTYKAFDADNNQETYGLVMPVIDLEMQPQEMFLFVNDQAFAFQDEIAGVRQKDGPEEQQGGGLPREVLPIAQAQGDGAFIFQVTSTWKALPPMTVHGMTQSPDGGVQFEAETVLDGTVTLTVTPGLQEIQQMGEGQYAIPDFFSWMPLENPMHLAKTADVPENNAQAQKAPGTVGISSTGPGEFSMKGPPVEKLARDQRTFIKTAEAEFLLVGMGVHEFHVKELLKTAEQRGTVYAHGLREITPLADVHREMVKKAAMTLDKFPYHLRRDLIKEAAVLEDGDTADKVLAMNFLNPENIGTFAKYLPELDAAAGKLAEMLLACRMGMKQVDEGAIERSMKNLEEVISGLKMLKQDQMV